MSDEGRNGIADRKHEKPPKGIHFRPRARRARGRKWLLLEARGMIFFLLKCSKTIYAQVTYAEIAFIYKFFRNLYFRKYK